MHFDGDTFDTGEPTRPSPEENVPGDSRQSVNVPVPPDACQNLSSAICGGNAAQTAQSRAQAGQQLGNTLLNTYVQNRVNSLAGNAGNFFANRFVGQRFTQVFNAAMQGALQNPLFQGVFKDFYDFASRQLPNLQSVVDPILDSLEKAIDKSGFDNRDKVAMKTKIEGTHFRYEPNFNDPDDIREYLQTCGFGGLTPNARAIPERNEVFVCPGMMLNAIATSGFKDAVWGIFHVVAHETGHLIGADRDVEQAPDQFNILRNFVRENPFSRAHENTYACLEERLPFQLNNQERGETTADWLADQALNERLEDSGINGATAFGRVSEALAGLCASPSEGIHPAGTTRIQIASWSVGSDLGCRNTKPQCTPDGSNGDLDAGFLGVAPVSDAGLQFSGGGGNAQGGGTNSPVDPNLQQALSQIFGVGGQNQGGFGLQGAGGGFGLQGAGGGGFGLQGAGGGFGLQGAGNNGQFGNLGLLGNQLTPEEQILGRLGLNGSETSGFEASNPFGNVSPFVNNGFGLNGFNGFSGNRVFFQGGPFSRFSGIGF